VDRHPKSPDLGAILSDSGVWVQRWNGSPLDWVRPREANPGALCKVLKLPITKASAFAAGSMLPGSSTACSRPW
jgi:hypothetical protein